MQKKRVATNVMLLGFNRKNRIRPVECIKNFWRGSFVKKWKKESGDVTTTKSIIESSEKNQKRMTYLHWLVVIESC